MKKIIELELERRALHETLCQLSRGDSRMEIDHNEFCKELEQKIEVLTEQINAYYDSAIEEDRKKINELRSQIDEAANEAKLHLLKR
jgi:chaperonin cofactor prefoldin